MILCKRNRRIEPEFGAQIIAIHMHVTRLTAIIGIEVKPIRTDP